MNILLTGGAGYIGSHTAVALLQAGHHIIVADDYSNSSPVAIERIKVITQKDFPAYAVNAADRMALRRVFAENAIDCVIHFAGKKAVGESVKLPVAYYRNNLDSLLSVLECMAEFHVSRIVFSSSATVYGSENPVPYNETMPRGVCSSPYGWTKAMIEQILQDACTANATLSAVLLRYFNPIGAHPSGLIGEDPTGIPNNLMPYICQVAVGKREALTVFGNDYPTPDGTCRRDYIHVEDLASGHLLAVGYAMEHTGAEVFNLGTGEPCSVDELVKTFETVNGVAIPRQYGPRRAGDLPECWADAAKAGLELHWHAEKSIADMCRDSWRWQKNNPNGYNSKEK